MAPGQMNYLVFRVCVHHTIYRVFFAQPPLAIRYITHQVTYDHTGPIASDVGNAAIPRPRQLSSYFLEKSKKRSEDVRTYWQHPVRANSSTRWSRPLGRGSGRCNDGPSSTSPTSPNRSSRPSSMVKCIEIYIKCPSQMMLDK